MKRQTPFQPDRKFKEKIQASVTALIAQRQKSVNESLISPDNVLRYSHGATWSHPATDAEDGGMESHSAEFALPFKRLADGDLVLIQEVVNHLSSEFEQQLRLSMYSMINRSCEKSGNTVNAKESSLPEAFEKMLETIEFGVDRFGGVSLPSLHTSDPQKMIGALQSQPPEYHARIDQLIERKKTEALEKESHRRSKFKSRQE